MNAHNSTTVTADDNQRPSMAVVDLVSEATGIDILELDPLYNAIDPDVLDTLCTSSSGFTSLEFQYASHTVVVEQVEIGVEISLEPVTIGASGSSGVADSGPSA
ncbi:HalOD1 output domain-containing protein [Natronorubrum sp. FCH18a]|uniref:HalOD1 output domain-containing protein n=1 Tax=Natronorubrum sp. FCH18a TaxID=3447018 RepID=UPI003F51A09E